MSENGASVPASRLYLAAGIIFLLCALVKAHEILTVEYTTHNLLTTVLWSALAVAFLAFSRRG